MKKMTFSFLAIALGAQIALATGMIARTTCTPILPDDVSATIGLQTTSTAPPGGPIKSSQTLTVDGKDYERQSEGKYDQGLTLKMVPLKYPSGGVSTTLKFITLNPGKASVKAIKEVLYNCSTKVGM